MKEITKEITKDEITELALLELLEHELIGVEFSWDQRKDRIGVVGIKWDRDDNPTIQYIKLSEWIFNALEDKWQMVDTLYHELAHMVAVRNHGRKGYGHNSIWRHYCRKFGAVPKRDKDRSVGVKSDAYKYTGYCTLCNFETGFAKMGKVWKRTMYGYASNSYICPKCKIGLKVRQNY
jgi:predicted SprT family Zn-dependent metalloprotease